MCRVVYQCQWSPPLYSCVLFQGSGQGRLDCLCGTVCVCQVALEAPFPIRGVVADGVRGHVSATQSDHSVLTSLLNRHIYYRATGAE